MLAVKTAAVHRFGEIYLVSVEFGPVHARIFYLSVHGNAASSAHTGAVHHDAVHTDDRRYTVSAGEFADVAHHYHRSDDKNAVDLIASVYQLLQHRRDEAFDAQRAVVGGDEQFLAVVAESVDKLEKENVRVVYQGVDGAYAQQAMFAFFGENVNHFHVERWRDAMDAIAEGMADYAVLPIENSTAGIVNDNYDLLEEYDNYIVGEQILSIQHALLGTPDAELSDIRTVYSHPQGLMQCARYLDEHRDWKQISLLNTAMAAQKVAEEHDKSQAAIASTLAAKQHGLKVLEEGINRSGGNSTRFLIVTNQPIFCRDAEKVSICFEVSHESGCLYNVLSHFIYNNLNMCRIESRPIADRNWEYHFFVDFEGNLNDSAVKNALRGIREEALNLKILGNY